MTIQEKVGVLHTVRMLGNQISSNFTNTAPRARIEVHPSASLLEHKARKPYTITKQREKWTEEEHSKFLEALKLNGRAWRKIEILALHSAGSIVFLLIIVHIGTKTTVQIRSHAQKFFSKITREPRGFTSDSREIIEVPPPRPKKKPAHPYPRKFVGGIIPSVIMSSSSSPVALKFEKEIESSISVLSAADSDTTVSTEFHSKNVYIPSDLSAAGSSATSTVALEVDSSYKSSTEEDCGTPSHDMVSLCFPPTGKFNKELDSPDKDRHASTQGPSLVSFKLFGSTFEVSHPKTDASILCDNSLLVKESSTMKMTEEVCHEKQEKKESQLTLETRQTMSQGDLLEGFSCHSYQETVHGNQDAENSREGFNLLLPLQPLAGMVSSLYKVRKRTADLCENLHQKTNLCEDEISKVGQKSNDFENLAASENKIVHNSGLIEVPGYQEKIAVTCWKASVNSAFSKPMKLGTAQRGFLPYKRCKVEDDHNSQTDKEIRSQTIKLCL